MTAVPGPTSGTSGRREATISRFPPMDSASVAGRLDPLAAETDTTVAGHGPSLTGGPGVTVGTATMTRPATTVAATAVRAAAIANGRRRG
jgi:hypothetical protein